ncbi:MAG: aminoacyl-tRNA hydrolase [Flavobacteriaceae bacterium]|nr:aminoacyl-tRNA hydrolase [Flavobacteriaceae bacterium]
MNILGGFHKRKQQNLMNNYLIVGLGNVGMEYFDTRHNIGFYILDYIAQENKLKFDSKKLGYLTQWDFKGKRIFLLKPSTFMNLSGRSVNYWLQKKKISTENMIIIADELQLPFGKIRLRAKGSSAGHNGLNSIESYLGTQKYNRLRFGIGTSEPIYNKVAFVLGKWTEHEQKQIDLLLPKCAQIVNTFVLRGLSHTMNQYN